MYNHRHNLGVVLQSSVFSIGDYFRQFVERKSMWKWQIHCPDVLVWLLRRSADSCLHVFKRWLWRPTEALCLLLWPALCLTVGLWKSCPLSSCSSTSQRESRRRTRRLESSERATEANRSRAGENGFYWTRLENTFKKFIIFCHLSVHMILKKMFLELCTKLRLQSLLWNYLIFLLM